MERRRGLPIYQDEGTHIEDKNAHGVALSGLSNFTPRRAPLRLKNVNVSSLFTARSTKDARTKRNLAPLSHLQAPSPTPATTKRTLDVKPVTSIIRESKVTDGGASSRAKYHHALRRRMRDVPRDSLLVHQLFSALNNFCLLERTSQSTAEYDLLVNVKHALWLSPWEVLVSTDEPTVKTAVLHSSQAVVIPLFELQQRETPKRLAISSKCRLTLYNDINWYLKWKFL